MLEFLSPLELTLYESKHVLDSVIIYQENIIPFNSIKRYHGQSKSTKVSTSILLG